MTRRLGAAILALAVATAVAAVDRASAGSAQVGLSFTGQFLVATERLADPRFHRAVVYLIMHDAGGAMGVVVNRPLDEVPMTRVLEALGLDTQGVRGDIRVHYGGPVHPTRGLVLHTSDYKDAGTHVVGDGIAVTPDRAIFDAIAHGKGPRESLFTLGFAGWAPGQLESEMREGVWITVPADERLIFDSDSARKWERATAKRKIEL